MEGNSVLETVSFLCLHWEDTPCKKAYMCICTDRDYIVGQKWQIKLEYRLVLSAYGDTGPLK